MVLGPSIIVTHLLSLGESEDDVFVDVLPLVSRERPPEGVIVKQGTDTSPAHARVDLFMLLHYLMQGGGREGRGEGRGRGEGGGEEGGGRGGNQSISLHCNVPSLPDATRLCVS